VTALIVTALIMSANDLCEDSGVFSGATHFFAPGDGDFHPTEFALSRWGKDMLNGPAVVGLAAWQLEQEYGAPGFLPTRFTTDLFKAARRVPTVLRTRLVRAGGRIRNSECDVLQDDQLVARAVMVQYRTSEPPPGREWVGEVEFTAPAGVTGPAYYVGSDEIGWTPSAAEHQNTARKRVYHRPVDVVAGHASSPFVRTVVAAEATSLACNMGTHGIGYINGDLTVAMSRLPRGDYIGLQADSHWCSEGISVGATTLFDDVGPFGIGMVTAIANAAAQIDFTGPDIRKLWV